MAIGDEQGSTGRQEELKAIREEAVKSAESINFLNESIKITQKQLREVGGKDFMAPASVGMDSLTKKMSKITVETLKSSKARKAFGQDLIKAQEQQAQNEGALANIEKERRTLTLDIAKRQEEVAALQKQGAAAYGAEMDKVKGIVLLAKEDELIAERALQEARKTGDAAAIAAAEAQLGDARLFVREQESLENKTKKVAEEKRASFEKAAEEREEEITDLEKINSLYGAQSEQIKERNNELTVSINRGKELEKTMKAIDNAPGAFITAFEDFGKLAGQVPILGSAIQAITGDISKSAKLFRDAKAEGKSFFGALGTAASGFIKLGAFAAISAFISKVIEGAKIGSEAMKTLNKSVAGTSMDMSAQMGRIGAAAGKFTVPLNEAAATIAGINDSLGMSLDFTKETTEQAIKLANKYGVSVDAVAHIVKNSAANKKTMTETVDAVTAGVARFNEMNNVSISTKAIFEDIGKASATTLRGIGKQPGALAAAAAAARSLGMSMEDIRAASESTTDFQKSLTDEMTTEMMLGKQLNLNKLREAALTGDVKTQAEEMKRLVMENQGRIGNNVKLQEQFAATLGISRDQYNDMLKTQDAMSVLTSKSGAAQEENDKNRKKSNAEIAESVERSVGKLTSLADTLAKMQEGIATGAKGFFDDLVDGFKGDTLFDKVKNGLINAFKLSWKTFKSGITDLFNGDFSGTSLGRLLGSLAVLGGGAAIAIKGVSFIKGLKNLFKGERGSYTNPMNVKNVDGMGGLDSSDLTNKLGKAGFFKQVKTLFKKPAVFFRALKMKGGFLGKQIGRFGTMFSKIKLPNLTRIFSKIKLPNLTNIFKNLKLPKLPKLPNVGKGFMNMLSKFKIPTGAASGLLKTIGGKVLAPLELAMGAITGVNQVKDLTAEQKKEQGIKESMGTTEAGIIGALTGNANKGSVFSEKLGIEKGGAGDEALGIATSGLRGAATGAAIGSVIPVVGTAVGAVVGGAIGVVSEGFKVFSDPNSKLRKGLSEFATATYDKAALIGNKIKEGALLVGAKIKDFAVGVKDKAVQVAGRMKDFAVGVKDKALEFGSKVNEGIVNFATAAKDKALAFASSVGEGISNFATSAKDKAIELAATVGVGISNFATSAKEKIGSFASAVGTGVANFANSARDKIAGFASTIGDGASRVANKIGDFVTESGGFIGAVGAAASGLASKAKSMLGKAWKWVTGGDKTKSKAPVIKKEEIKKVTAPLMQMSKDQAKTFTTAINTAIQASTKGTVKAMDSLGDVLENPLGENAKAANNQLLELKKLKADGDKQHSRELMELRNQTALLFDFIKKPQTQVVKMNTFKVGQSLTRV